MYQARGLQVAGGIRVVSLYQDDVLEEELVAAGVAEHQRGDAREVGRERERQQERGDVGHPAGVPYQTEV